MWIIPEKQIEKTQNKEKEADVVIPQEKENNLPDFSDILQNNL